VLIVVLLPVYRRPGKQAVLELIPFPEEITQLFMDKFNMMLIAMFKGSFIPYTGSIPRPLAAG